MAMPLLAEVSAPSMARYIPPTSSIRRLRSCISWNTCAASWCSRVTSEPGDVPPLGIKNGHRAQTADVVGNFLISILAEIQRVVVHLDFDRIQDFVEENIQIDNLILGSRAYLESVHRELDCGPCESTKMEHMENPLRQWTGHIHQFCGPSQIETRILVRTDF